MPASCRADYPVTYNAVSGYSGGGKKMIEDYEAKGAAAIPYHPYGLTFSHKHLPEMQVYAELAHAPDLPAGGRQLCPGHDGLRAGVLRAAREEGERARTSAIACAEPMRASPSSRWRPSSRSSAQPTSARRR